MTREQVAKIREWGFPAGAKDEICDQLERALLLEDVLAAAKHVREHGPKHIEYSLPGLCAAIDRAEGRG